MTEIKLPHSENPLLRLSYSKLAPLYDLAVSAPLSAARTRSLQSLPADVAGPAASNIVR